MYAILQEIVFQLHLKLNVPKNLWYFTRYNGTVIVVPARLIEHRLCSNNIHARPGSNQLRAYTVGYDNESDVLLFSDQQEYQDPQGRRTSNGIVGSLSEFETVFCNVFAVQQRSIFIPPASELRHDGLVMGYMTDGTDAVMQYAREKCR